MPTSCGNRCIVGGTTDMGFINLPSALPLLKSGRMRALAITSLQPLPELPNVRTLKSLGMQDFVIEGWAALFAAKDVPPADALADPSVRERFNALGVEPRPGTEAALRDDLKSAQRDQAGRFISLRKLFSNAFSGTKRRMNRSCPALLPGV